ERVFTFSVATLPLVPWFPSISTAGVRSPCRVDVGQW
ncbi:hypothetical protein CSUI_006624, partial [Cystoisospora suis]